MKLIHLSDLHVGQSANKDKFERIIGHLNTAPAFEDPNYAIMITGDLINDAGDKDAHHEVRAMIDTLSPRFAKRVFLCPGNHDYGNFWGGHPNFIANFRQVFEPYLQGSGHIDPAAYLPEDMPYHSPFPIVDIIGDIALIGLDTTADELKDGYSLWAEGRMGKRQCKALDKLLALPQLSGKRIVIYFHHHPYHAGNYLNRFKDADDFRDVIRNRVHVLLFGHNHAYTICSSDSQQDGVAMALEGGKTTEEMRFRILDLDNLRFTEYSV